MVEGGRVRDVLGFEAFVANSFFSFSWSTIKRYFDQGRVGLRALRVFLLLKGQQQVSCCSFLDFTLWVEFLSLEESSGAFHGS